MVIKNIVKTSAEIKTIYTPAYKLKNGYNISDLDKGNEIIDHSISSYDFTFNFIGDLTYLKNKNISFTIEVFKDFTKDIFHRVNNLTWDDIENNTYTLNLPINKLNLDSEFIFRITYTVLSYPNELLDKETVFYLEEGIHQKMNEFNHENQYISLAYDVPLPELFLNEVNPSNSEPLKSYSFITTTSTTSMLMQYKYIGELMISLNGVTMSEGLDYEIENNVIKFFDVIPSETVVNLSYTGSDTSTGLSKDNFIIDTDNLNDIKSEGECFVNDGAYGLFLTKPIAKNSSPIVIINGVTLAKDLDYIIDNDNQTIILNGKLLLYDVIDVYYTAEFTTLSNVKSIKGYITNTETTGNEEGFHSVKISKKNDIDYTTNGIDLPFKKGSMLYEFDITVDEPGLYYVSVFTTKKLKNDKDIIKKGNTLKINITK